MTDAVDIVNQVLNELGREPVADYTLSKDSTLIYNKLLVIYPELLLRADWNFAIKYVTDNTPTTTNISPEYPYNYTLPPDYNRMDRISWYAINFGLIYRIIDGVIMTNTKPIQYYYVSNNPDFNDMDPAFYRCLVLYLASITAMAITNDEGLVAYLKREYKEKLSDAIRRNDMDRMIVTRPFSDFDRQTYI